MKAQALNRQHILLGVLVCLVAVGLILRPRLMALMESAQQMDRETAKIASSASPKNELDTAKATVDQKPDDLQARLRYAALLVQDTQYGEAQSQLNEAVRIAPESAEPHLAQAELFESSDMFDLAIAAARVAVELEPDHVGALIKLGQLYIGMDWGVAASRVLARAVEQHPNEPGPRTVLALTRYQMADYKGALQEIQEAKRLSPENHALDGTLIDIYLQLQQFDEALKATEAAITSTPNAPVPVIGKARVLNRMKRYSEAEAEVRPLLLKFSDNLAARYELAAALLGQQKDAAAAGELEAITRANFQYGRAVVLLAGIYNRQKRKEEAETLLRRFRTAEDANAKSTQAVMRVGNQPDSPEAHKEAGIYHFKDGRVPRAVVEFREALRLRPGDADTTRRLIQALEAMQRTEEARTVRASSKL